MGDRWKRHAEDLRWYWNDRKALGMRSAHAVMLASANHDAMQRVESWKPQRERAALVGNALRRLSPEQVQVLYAAYGPRNPAARTDVLDEPIARVAPYTEFVEQARRAIVEERAESRLALASDECDEQAARIAASHRRSANLEVSPWDALRALFGAPGRQKRHLEPGVMVGAETIENQASALLGDALEAYQVAVRNVQ